MHRLNLNGYEPDRHHEAAVAFCIHAGTDELTSPVHQHRKGQLILALHGAITCTVENALWMVLPQYAVWIPGGVKHSNQVTANAELCFLFIEPSAANPSRISKVTSNIVVSLPKNNKPAYFTLAAGRT